MHFLLCSLSPVHSPPPLPPDPRFNGLSFLSSRGSIALPQAWGCPERGHCEPGELQTGGQLSAVPPGRPLWREGALLFCSEMPGEGQPGWDLSEGDTHSDINYWLLSSARSPFRHQQMVDSMGEGGQSRYKAWA